MVGGFAADTENPTPTAPENEWLPAVGSTHQGCTVLAATATSDDTADMPAFSAATVLTPGRYYLYDADGTLRTYRAGQPWPTGTTAVNFSGGKTIYLRPVAEVSINKE